MRNDDKRTCLTCKSWALMELPIKRNLGHRDIQIKQEYPNDELNIRKLIKLVLLANSKVWKKHKHCDKTGLIVTLPKNHLHTKQSVVANVMNNKI